MLRNCQQRWVRLEKINKISRNTPHNFCQKSMEEWKTKERINMEEINKKCIYKALLRDMNMKNIKREANY